MAGILVLAKTIEDQCQLRHLTVGNDILKYFQLRTTSIEPHLLCCIIYDKDQEGIPTVLYVVLRYCLIFGVVDYKPNHLGAQTT